MRVLILSKKELFALNVMRCLSDVKAECHVFGHGMMWAVILSKYCRRYSKCDFEVFQAVPDLAIDKIRTYCSKHKISFIIAADYDTSQFLSRIRSQLGHEVFVFPGVSSETLETLNNKWKFAQLLEKNDLPHPRTILVENAEQLSQVVIEFPRIVKPLKCEGGLLSEYVKKNAEEYLANGSLLSNFPMLVQEFIPGEDVCFSILAHRGKIVAWTMQRWINSYTSQFFTSRELFDLGQRVVAVTNYEGVAHFDLRIDARDNSIKFIECNPRFWNSLRASKWNGVNFVVLGIMLAEGREIPENTSNNIRYVLPARVFSELKMGKILSLKNIPYSTRNDLKQMFGDPLSLICSMFSKRL